MSRLDVMVIGPGAIGGMVSWALSKTNVDVILKVKNEEQRSALLDKGLIVEFSRGKTRKSRDFLVVTNWDELDDIPKWIFVTLKIPDLLRETESLKRYAASSNHVVYFQNGVLGDYLPKKLISRGVQRVICWWSAQMLEFGSIAFVRSGETHVGSLGNSLSEKDRNELLTMLQHVPSTIRWFDDIRGPELAKTIFNSALNGLTYLTGMGLGEILGSREGKAAFEGIVTEGVLLSDKLGLSLPTIRRMSLRDFSSLGSGLIVSLKKRMYWRALQRIGKNLISSARISYLRGRSSELPWLNGYIVRKGWEMELEMPWNETLMEYHDKIESREVEPSPDLLTELYNKVAR